MANVPIVTEKTYSEMAALIAESKLNLALSYKITERNGDPNYKDNGLLFRAAAPNRLENDGLRYMLCPATYAVGADAYENDWIGVWNATKNTIAAEGQLTIWNGLVWIAGAILSGNAPDVESSGWTVISKTSFTNHEYDEMIFGVTYDFDEDWINEQRDKYGNVFGQIKSQVNQMVFNGNNPIDYCDWNILTSDVMFYGNKLAYFINCQVGSVACENIGFEIKECIADSIMYNNCPSIKNVNADTITSNNCTSGINDVIITGAIEFNDVIEITHVRELSGHQISILNNRFNGSITGTFDADVTDPIVDKIGTAV